MKTRIGKMLHEYRILKNLSAESFANEVGMTRTRLSQVENGHALSKRAIAKIAKAAEGVEKISPSIKNEANSLINFAIEIKDLMKLANYRAFYIDIAARKKFLADLAKLGEDF